MENQAYSLGFRSVGEDVLIWPFAKIIEPQMISIGNSVIVDDFVFMMGSVTLSDFIHIASHASICGGGELVMENFSGLSGGVRVYTGNEDYTGRCMTNPTVPQPYRVPQRSFVHIRKHAIVGANAVILPGVEIGEGAVVGAGSLVTKNCEPWTVYFGSPAKPIKRRKSSIILGLEGQLRAEVYRPDGSYIPKKLRQS